MSQPSIPQPPKKDIKTKRIESKEASAIGCLAMVASPIALIVAAATSSKDVLIVAGVLFGGGLLAFIGGKIFYGVYKDEQD